MEEPVGSKGCEDSSNNNMEEPGDTVQKPRVTERQKSSDHRHTRMSFRSLSMVRQSSREQNGRSRERKQSKLEQSCSPSVSSQGSLGEQASDSPRRVGRFHQAVRLGRGTMSLIEKWKSVSRDDNEKDEEDLVPLGKVEREDSSEGDPGKKSSWSEHVWSTFIHRGYSDDVTENKQEVRGAELLTEFQKDKFKYFFYHVLDLNTDHVISSEDFVKLNSRIKHYMDWSVNTLQFLALKEVHGVLLEYFLSTAAALRVSQDTGTWDPFPQAPDAEIKCCVSIDEWLEVWGTTVGRARKINDLPMWLQYYPKILFDTINRSGSGQISRQELQLFYTAFLDVGTLGEQKIQHITDKAFEAMTSNGDVTLDFHIYKLSFLNFLLGKQPNGPGQFIFGPVIPASGSRLFTVDYSALTLQEEEGGAEVFTPEVLAGGGDRKSIIV